ncbi:hypothetical protein BRADI_1g12497v3 [Brachypodium distachyon]|uniref:Uncharacterized protein n=1 Tax=Brachypodium distachyon TaxID=15368 RepID=A0A0Q3RLJ8_BRADI|nr:hypothetical protein BRADI_1g12497v3 [Brachypodium distachyon]
MRRYSPPYRSPLRRGYGGRGRSPPRRGYGGLREQGSGSLLLRIYEFLLKGLVLFGMCICQRIIAPEINVVLAAESWKRPEDMRNRASVRGYSGEHEGRRFSRYGRSHSRSRSYSPRYRGRPRSRQSPRRQPKEYEEDRRRSYSPAGRGGSLRGADNNAHGKRSPPADSDGSPPHQSQRSPGQSPGSPMGSRSRSPDASPVRSD